jgi:hypothetical protein
MFASAAVFGAILAIMTVFILYSQREEARILATGRRTTVTVVSKYTDRRKQSPGVEIRRDDAPGEGPFLRAVRRDDWERVEPGGTLPYVYDPADPQRGVLGTPQEPGALGCFYAAASVLIVPFLLIGIVLKIRERRATTPS